MNPSSFLIFFSSSFFFNARFAPIFTSLALRNVMNTFVYDPHIYSKSLMNLSRCRNGRNKSYGWSWNVVHLFSLFGTFTTNKTTFFNRNSPSSKCFQLRQHLNQFMRLMPCAYDDTIPINVVVGIIHFQSTYCLEWNRYIFFSSLSLRFVWCVVNDCFRMTLSFDPLPSHVKSSQRKWKDAIFHINRIIFIQSFPWKSVTTNGSDVLSFDTQINTFPLLIRFKWIWLNSHFTSLNRFYNVHNDILVEWWIYIFFPRLPFQMKFSPFQSNFLLTLTATLQYTIDKPGTKYTKHMNQMKCIGPNNNSVKHRIVSFCYGKNKMIFNFFSLLEF